VSSSDKYTGLVTLVVVVTVLLAGSFGAVAVVMRIRLGTVRRTVAVFRAVRCLAWVLSLPDGVCVCVCVVDDA
jgi:hypothetical protein